MSEQGLHGAGAHAGGSAGTGPPGKDPPGGAPTEGTPKDLGDLLRRLGGEVFAIPIRPQAPPAGEIPRGRSSRGFEGLRFDRKPEDVKAHLDRFVIGQDEAKKALAVAVCDHYNHVRRMMAARPDRESLDRATRDRESLDRETLDHEARDRDPTDREAPDAETIEYAKQNVILVGPTGVGKTYIIRTLAQLIGVPFVKADITKFSETGYVGGDVDDLVRELVRVADGDVRLAECGIIFLDEIDKIASASNLIGRDVSGRGVQTGLLKLLEETEVSARSPTDMAALMQEMMQMRQGREGKRTINTRHILFVVSGAFPGLAEIVERRLSERNVGFRAAQEGAGTGRDEALLAQATTRDFVEYGFEPEFIGRLPVRVDLRDLTEEDLFRILTSSEGSILKQHRENFRGYGIGVAFDEDAIRVVAKRALEEKTGARGLMTVLESALRDFKFHLPSSPLKHFVVDGETIEEPATVLARILADPEAAERRFAVHAVREFERGFAARHGIRLDLDDSAIEMALTFARDLHVGVKEYLEGVFRDHGDFLTKVGRELGVTRLPVTPQVLSRPGDGLDLWLAGHRRAGS